jgi:hypothetical protein
MRLQYRKPRLRAVGTRCVDHATFLYPQKLALNSPNSCGRSDCIQSINELQVHSVLSMMTDNTEQSSAAETLESRSIEGITLVFILFVLSIVHSSHTVGRSSVQGVLQDRYKIKRQNNKQTPWPLVRNRTIPTDRPPLVDEIYCQLLWIEGCCVVSAAVPPQSLMSVF